MVKLTENQEPARITMSGGFSWISLGEEAMPEDVGLALLLRVLATRFKRLGPVAVDVVRTTRRGRVP